MVATIRWILLIGFVAASADATTLPQRYVDLLTHEADVDLIALSDAELAAYSTPRDAHAHAYCAALEHRVRIDIFIRTESLAKKRGFVEGALECRRAHPKNTDDRAQVAWLQAQRLSLMMSMGDRSQSLTLFDATQKVLKAKRSRIAPADFAIGAAALGDVAYSRDDFRTSYEWAHTATEATHNGDTFARMHHAHELKYECFRLGRLGRFTEAQLAGEQAVKEAAQLFATPSLVHTDALFILGEVQYFANDFAQARETLAQSIAEARKLGERGQTSLATGLGFWGNLQRRIGNYPGARAALTESIAIARREPNPNHNRVDPKLTNLALLEIESGHCDAAIAPLREALESVSRNYGPDSVELVPKLANLGACELEGGQIKSARTDLNRTLAIATKSYGKSNPQLAMLNARLAEVDLAEQDLDAATKRLRHALSLLPSDTEILAADRIIIERNLASSLHLQGHDSEAFEHAVAAETSRQRLLRRFATTLDEGQGLNLRQTLSGGMDQVLALAATRTDPVWAQRAWQLEIGSRLLISRLVAARLKAASNSSDPVIAALWQQWQVANGVYAKALHSVEFNNAGAITLQARREGLDRAEQALAAHIPRLVDVPPDMATVRGALSADSALIGFALGSSDPWVLTRSGQQTGAQHFYAFRLVSGNEPVLIDLGDALAIAAAVRDWTAALRDPARKLADVSALGADVRRRIWDPLGLSPTLRHVFIVPEGELHRIAWLALPLRNGMLVESGVVPQLLDSARDLAATTVTIAATDRALLVGAVPVTTSIDACTHTTSAALPGARREIDSLRKLWDASQNGRGSIYLAGNDATKSAVLAAMPQSSFIHFATHAISEDSDCAARPVATRGIRIAQSDSSHPTAELSGLLLAPDSTTASAHDDGLLTAQEIATLNLDSAASVTLSACDTGLGPIQTDEGVFGLARAFRLAGARSVVMSLWSVDDDATAQLMQRMYRARWIDHAAPADALTLAARETLAARRAAGQSIHPYYWAGFVATDSRH